MVLQQIAVDKGACDTPHEMGVDQETGDVYLACVAMNSNSTVQKYSWTG